MDKFVIKSKRKNEEGDEKGTKSKEPRVDGDNDVKLEASLDKELTFRRIRGDGLNCDYTILYCQREADELLKECEENLEYNTGDLARVHVFGKWHSIPRKQVQ